MAEKFNPAPLHLDDTETVRTARALWAQSADNTRLRMAVWSGQSDRRGTILFLPGRGDYIELFEHVFSDFADIGYDVLGIDWRGHGLSDRLAKDPKAGHISSFLDYQIDLQKMFEVAHELDLPKPWFLIGHSMGGCIALRAMLNDIPIAASAFTAPMWDIKLSAFERIGAWPLTWSMNLFGVGARYAPGQSRTSNVAKIEFGDNHLTNDSVMYERWRQQGRLIPDLHIGGPSMGWLFAALKETKALSKKRSPRMNAIVLVGDQEEVVSVEAINSRVKTWPDCTQLTIPNAKHELFLEVPKVRSLAFDQISRFFADQ